MSSGPASLWTAREVRELEGEGDVGRGSAFFCQLAGTAQRRPVGILTNLFQVQSKLFLRWPCLILCGDELHHNGPLPISCPSAPQHDPFRGTDELADFVALLPNHRASLSGSCVWPGLLTDRSSPLEISFVDAAPPSPGYFFSFSSSVHSRSSLFSHWQRFPDAFSPGGSRQFQVSAFLETPVPPDTPSARRSAFGSACRVTAVGLALGTSTLLQSSFLLSPSMAIPRSTSSSHRQRDRRSSPPFLLLRSVARTPKSTERPLLRLRPRGYTPHGYSGVDVGLLVTGASAGVVRTRTFNGVTLRCPF